MKSKGNAIGTDAPDFGEHGSYSSAPMPNNYKAPAVQGYPQPYPSGFTKPHYPLPQEDRISKVHNIQLNPVTFVSSVTKTTQKSYNPITNPIAKVQQNPYMQRGKNNDLTMLNSKAQNEENVK